MAYRYNCKVKDCNNYHYALGLCRKHYARFIRKGNTKLLKAKYTECCVICKKYFITYINSPSQTCSFKCGILNRKFKTSKRFFKNGNSEYKNHSFFKKQRKIILEMGNYKCVICGTNKKRIIIHHKDFTKTNHELLNLIPLCESCHKTKHLENKVVMN